MNRRDVFRNARNFALFYGHGEAEKLSRYEIAIVEPAGHDLSGLTLLRRSGALVIGYISVVEIASWDSAGELLQEEDFLEIAGEPVSNPAFGTRLIDLRSKRWKGILHQRIGRMLMHGGYDGVFLDTIGNVEWPGTSPALREELTAGASEFVHDLRRFFPDRIIIQNNGLEELIVRTASVIDAVCWENPPFAQSAAGGWCATVTERLIRLSGEFGFRGLLLFEESSVLPAALSEAERLTRNCGFLTYIAPPQYLDIRE